MATFNMQALVNYAKTPDPVWKNLPADVLLTVTKTCIVVRDAYPKAKYHYLILPRLPCRLPNSASTTATDDDVAHQHIPAAKLINFESLLRDPNAVKLLACMNEVAEEVCEMIRADMQASEDAVWGIQCGFHKKESMPHLHLHIISQDFVAAGMKSKKHWHSFRPDGTYWLPLDEALNIARDRKAFRTLSEGEAKQLQSQSLASFRTGRQYVNIPALKAALEQEWQAEIARAKAKPKATVVNARNSSSPKKPVVLLDDDEDEKPTVPDADEDTDSSATVDD